MVDGVVISLVVASVISIVISLVKLFVKSLVKRLFVSVETISEHYVLYTLSSILCTQYYPSIPLAQSKLFINQSL